MILSVHTLGVLLLALIIDRIIGDPDWLWKRIPHPVVIFGHVVAALDRTLNASDHGRFSARLKGFLAVVLVIVPALISGVVFHLLLRPLAFGGAAEAILAAFLIAQKGLVDHLRAVSRSTTDEGIEAGRIAIGKIVGRNTDKMKETDISRAAIESAAENFSDGVIAPAFWFLICGLPGLFVYKAVNTADSMIGHKTDRHIQFGYASARLDDLLNYIPARISAILIAISAPWLGGGTGQSLLVIRSDASSHVSPNAGWPEAAMAGALDVALGGPRQYGDEIVNGVWIHPGGRRMLGSSDIDRSVRLLDVAWLLVATALTGICLTIVWLRQ